MLYLEVYFLPAVLLKTMISFLFLLDELQDIEITHTENRLTVTADANLFNMREIRNRTRATYLPPDYVPQFNYSLNFPIKELRYEAVFQYPAILR